MNYIIDSLMGTGKTNNSHKMLNKHRDEKFVYMTPLLEEFPRLQNTCHEMHFIDPQPYPTKTEHLRNLAKSGSNIVTTHELIKRMRITDEDREAFNMHHYSLVIDEAVDTISEFKHFKDADFNKISPDITIDQNGWVTWETDDREKVPGRYEDVYETAQSGNLYSFENKLLWRLPLDFIDCFDDVFIMTYNFENSHMAYDFAANGYQYEFCHFDENGELVPGKQDTSRYKEAFRDRVKIYTGPCNDFGEEWEALSANKWKNLIEIETDKSKDISKHQVRSMLMKFRNLFDAMDISARNAIYARYLRAEEKMTNGEPNIKYFIDHYKSVPMVRYNTTGTNKYRTKTAILYGVNVFESPSIQRYYKKQNVPTYSEEGHALNTMLQWIYRSAIRNVDVPKDDPLYNITLGIPSRRMREMLTRWSEE